MRARTMQMRARTIVTHAFTRQMHNPTIVMRARTMQMRARTIVIRAFTMQIDNPTIVMRARTMQMRARTVVTHAFTKQMHNPTIVMRARTMQMRAHTIVGQGCSLRSNASHNPLNLPTATLARMKSIVVFCGSAEGYNELYREAAYELGAALADKNITLIYGGSKLGLMGAVADGALNNGGSVTGIIPQFLKTKEVVHEGLTEMITVQNMHERKLKMHERSDGIIALPGGWGTLEELFEMMTWAQLGLHRKPVGILNVNNYYDPLLAMLSAIENEGFVAEKCNEMMLRSYDVSELLQMMGAYIPQAIKRGITKEQT